MTSAPDREDVPMGPEVFTVGYERRDAAALVDELVRAGVEVLVDVRELPLSRRPGFSKTALRERLESASIEYVHERALGNPKPYRELYWRGQVEQGALAYRAHLYNGSYQSVVGLAERVTESAVCLMCVEHDHTACHRAIIVEALQELLAGLRVQQL